MGQSRTRFESPTMVEAACALHESNLKVGTNGANEASDR